jgi:Ca2+-binding RTX toxin-like protein
MWLGPGNDRAEGGEGNDEIFGEGGDDSLAGGADNDEVAGELGADRLEGGAGSDRVLSGLSSEYRYSNEQRTADGWRDEVDCGEGIDFSNANRWDAVANCERIKRTRMVGLGKLRRLPSGVAILPVKVEGSGRLRIAGPGLRPVSIQITSQLQAEKATAALRLRARGAALRKLRAHGRATVRLWLRFEPEGGIVRAEPLTVKLTSSR